MYPTRFLESTCNINPKVKIEQGTIAMVKHLSLIGVETYSFTYLFCVYLHIVDDNDELMK